MDSRYTSLYDLLQNKILLNDELIYLINNDKLKAYNPNGVPIKIFDFSFTDDKYNNNYVCTLKLGDAISSMSTHYPDIISSDENINSQDDLKYTDDDCVVQYHHGNDIYVLEEDIRKIIKSVDNKSQGDVVPVSSALQADTKIPAPKTLGALYSFILALVHEKGIDLVESGLQTNLVVTAKELGLPLSKGFVSETIKELADYENAHKG